MELTFEKDDLLHALQILQGVASGRTTLPILAKRTYSSPQTKKIEWRRYRS